MHGFQKRSTLLFQILVMKTSNKLVAVMLLCASFFFTNCTPKEDNLSTPKEILTRGNWTVEYYFNGSNHTNNYNEYSFSFSPGGNLNCSNTAAQYAGDWRVIQNTQSEMLSIKLSAAQADLLELNDDWTISSFDAQTISLQKAGEQLRLRKR